MPKVAVIAKLTASSGKRDELVVTLGDLVVAAESEPGTEMYVVHVDTGDDGAVWFYELYTDQDSLTAHMGSEAMKRTGAKLAALLAAPPEIHVVAPAQAHGLGL